VRQRQRNRGNILNLLIAMLLQPNFDMGRGVGPPHKLTMVGQVSLWDPGNVALVLSIVTFEKRSRLMGRPLLTFSPKLHLESIVMLC
jgi:hypothetical protein